MKNKNFPSDIVNLGHVNKYHEELGSTDYYQALGLSEYASRTLAEHNKNGYPIDEFYWLDKKWWDFYCYNVKVVNEVQELVGGAFSKLNLESQCRLLELPYFPKLRAPVIEGSRQRAKWLSPFGARTPEVYIEDIINSECQYPIVIGDEGEHLNVWLTKFSNLYLEHQEAMGEPKFPKDWGTDKAKRRERSDVINYAAQQSEEHFFAKMEDQINSQIEQNWWTSKHSLEETMNAAKTWGREKILTMSDLNMWGAGKPDITTYNGRSHTMLEVKTTDKLHQSQAFFVRNTKNAMDLDIKVVQLIKSDSRDESQVDDFISWLSC